MEVAATLPDEIMMNILQRFSVKYLSRFKCVCKSWRSLISDPYFAGQHVRHATSVGSNTRILYYHGEQHWYDKDIPTTIWKSIDIHEVEKAAANNKGSFIELPIRDVNVPNKLFGVDVWIKGCCDGIICLVDQAKVVLWNPCIKVLRILPPLQLKHHHCDEFGMGYDSSIDDYKVVRVHSIYDAADENKVVYSHSVVDVLALKSNTWKTSHRKFPYPYMFEYFNTSVYTNGGIHWLLHPFFDDRSSTVILCFDVVLEIFSEIPLPYKGKKDYYPWDLLLIRGNLAVKSPYESQDVWIRNDYGVNGRWTRFLTVGELFKERVVQGSVDQLVFINSEKDEKTDNEIVDYGRKIHFTEHGFIVLTMNDFWTDLVMCKRQNETHWKSYSFATFRYSTHYLQNIITYVESLVSPFRGFEGSMGVNLSLTVPC